MTPEESAAVAAKRSQKIDPTESPTCWFAILEGALRKEDYELAAKAKRELQRLGVQVSFSNVADRQVTTT
jgi:hypothetical protein